jgi:hypothetical protein
LCHVLSEGSKWSGWVRPCGLSPCAPRYYYSTPRCTLVYSLVLSSVCCASVWCCAPCPVVCLVPCLPCLWCVCVVLWLWCVGVSCPCSPCPLWVCATVRPCTPCAFPVFFLGIIPAPYMGGAICGPCTFPIYVPYFLGLLFMICSVHTVKAGPWIPNVDFQKSA